MRLLWTVLLMATLSMAGDADVERMKLARTAMEAKLRLGDALHQKGDLAGAIEAYRGAIAIWDGFAMGARQTPKEPKAVDKPKEQPRIPRAPVAITNRAAVRRSIQRGIVWLIEHQDDDGRWDADGFMRHDPAGDKSDGKGGALYDIGVTSLATLAFLRAGYTDKNTPYGRLAHRALQWLVMEQGQDGVFGGRASQHYIYNHVLATLAVCEAFRLTRDPSLAQPAKRAISFLERARNPYMGWRYEARGGENDTSVTSWCVMTLKAAKFAGFKVSNAAFEGARQWIDKATDPEFGRVGYNMPGGSPARLEGMQDRFPPEKSQAMTAAGIWTRVMLGEDPRKSAMIRKGAGLCADVLPSWNPKDGSIDMYYWFMGTGAAYEIGGSFAVKWNRALHAALVQTQHVEGSRDGSWDPAGAWGPTGGRVYATAINTLSLLQSIRDPEERIYGVRK